MIELDLHPEAHRDYEAAYDWYAKQDLSAAEAFDAELREAFAKLLRDPELGMAFDKEHLFYRLKRFPYYVVFRLEPARLFVVAVSHNRRDPAYWQGR